MYTIKTFNKISKRIYDHLDKENFSVTDEGTAYDAALVRSADLHEEAFPVQTVAVARAGAGVNNIPIDACSEKGIVVFNTPGANANAVTELVLCALLLSGRRVVEGMDWLKEQKAAGQTGLEKLAEKAKSQFVGPELRGKKLGIIGLGAIGIRVANAARSGLGMEVIGYDPFLSVDAAWHLNSQVIHAKTVDEILTQCDYITLHLPYNEKTKNMIGNREFALMKDDVVLLNFARGGLVDSSAAMSALISGKLRRYVTDFAVDELIGLPGVITTPHLGASTPESEENCADMAAQELKSFLKDGTIQHSVNLPDCEMARGGIARVTLFHRNITNMIVQITACLSEENVNIENMLNKSRGDWAYTMLDLNDVPSRECLKKLTEIPAVVRVRLL